MIGLSGTRGPSSDWARLVEDHADALQEYRLAAGALERTMWATPIAPGKWSPAEITAHVAEAYRVLSAELGGADGMSLKGSWLQRLVLRHTILPRLLTGKPFPPGVRAPRETRPTEIIEDLDLAVATLVKRAEQFTRDLTAKASTQDVRLTHAYFGRLSSRQGLELSTAHTRHHAQQLAAITRSPLAS
ncbi:MAG TPA: DinB family protein [Gemmatimonadales bacterium]